MILVVQSILNWGGGKKKRTNEVPHITCLKFGGYIKLDLTNLNSKVSLLYLNKGNFKTRSCKICRYGLHCVSAPKIDVLKC